MIGIDTKQLTSARGGLRKVGVGLWQLADDVMVDQPDELPRRMKALLSSLDSAATHVSGMVQLGLSGTISFKVNTGALAFHDACQETSLDLQRTHSSLTALSTGIPSMHQTENLPLKALRGSFMITGNGLVALASGLDELQEELEKFLGGARPASFAVRDLSALTEELQVLSGTLLKLRREVAVVLERFQYAKTRQGLATG